MIKKIIEHREMQQLRKDHKRKQNMRLAAIGSGVCLALLGVIGVIEAATPPQAVPAVQTVQPTPSPEVMSQSEIDEIMEKPIHELSEAEKEIAAQEMAKAAIEGFEEGSKNRK